MQGAHAESFLQEDPASTLQVGCSTQYPSLWLQLYFQQEGNRSKGINSCITQDYRYRRKKNPHLNSSHPAQWTWAAPALEPCHMKKRPQNYGALWLQTDPAATWRGKSRWPRLVSRQKWLLKQNLTLYQRRRCGFHWRTRKQSYFVNHKQRFLATPEKCQNQTVNRRNPVSWASLFHWNVTLRGASKDFAYTRSLTLAKAKRRVPHDTPACVRPCSIPLTAKEACTGEHRQQTF